MPPPHFLIPLNSPVLILLRLATLGECGRADRAERSRGKRIKSASEQCITPYLGAEEPDIEL